MIATTEAASRDTMLSRRASLDSCPILADPTDPLQIWSTEAVPYREDVFRLEDGRLVSISAARTASMERLEYSVQILTPSASSRKHYVYDIEGHCGSMYWHPSGSWELYPRERMVKSQHRNRHGIPSGVHCTLKASTRLAALNLIAASDRLTRQQETYIQPGKGLKVGRQWQVIALGNKPEHFGQDRPEPNSLRVHNGCSQHFMATKMAGDCGRGGSESSVRIVVSSEPFYSNGLTFRGVSCQTYFTWENLKVPASVISFCVDRCRHV